MKLYIEVENGATKNHPAVEENLLESFGGIPSNWEPFVRAPKPEVYLKKTTSDTPEYHKVDGVWTDVWVLVDVSPEEKAEAIRQKHLVWASLPNASNFTSWVFNETTGEFDPPVPRPTNTDINYRWCGAENNWKEAPTKPVDGNPYKFDFVAWQWVTLVK
jgi:hypothetical protein